MLASQSCGRRISPGVGNPTVGTPIPTSSRGHGRKFKARGAPTVRAVATGAAAAEVDGRATARAISSHFGAVEREVRQPEELKVLSGEVPKWLAGSYYRNGPGSLVGVEHLFDGFGMILHLSFEDGRVYQRQRYVESEAYKAFKRDGKRKFSEFGTHVPLLDSLANTFKGMLGLGQGFTDNAGVSVLPMPALNKLMVMTETEAGTLWMERDSLKTEGPVQFDGKVAGDLTTAHPTLLPDGVTLVNVQQKMFETASLWTFNMLTGERKTVAEIPISLPNNSWVHSFPVTPNLAVIPETPITYNVMALMGVEETPFVNFDWLPELKTKLHVVSLKDGRVSTHPAPSYYALHYCNAFEHEHPQLGRCISFDAPHSVDPRNLEELKMRNLRSSRNLEARAVLTRVTIPLDCPGAAAIVRELVPGDGYGGFCELPCINPEWQFREDYRYVYAGGLMRPTMHMNSVVKMDVASGQTVGSWHESGCLVSEPCFIPRPGATAEDDGVLLAHASLASGASVAVLLDGATMEELARVRLATTCPVGFHGSFVSTPMA